MSANDFLRTALECSNAISVAGVTAGQEIAWREYEVRLRAAEKAMRACHAWHIAEQKGIGSFQARMELCSYSEWLVAQWLELNSAEYAGVPRMVVYPEVRIDRASEESAQALVDEVFAYLAQQVAA